MSRPENPIDVISRLAETHRQIRFGRGVVGKTGHATIGVIGLWGLIIWRLTENLWFDIALIGGGLVVTLIYAWWVKSTQAFAKENPGLALMEGAELLEYQRFEAQAKGLPSAVGVGLIVAPSAPNRITSDPQQPDRT